MPINQDKYIKINSEIVAGSSVRSFCGLVLTSSEEISELTRMTLADVVDTFGENSDEAKYASRYFAFSGADGRRAREIAFAPYTVGEELDGFKAVLDGEDINFGSFTFLQSLALSATTIKAIDTFNEGLGRKYLFVQPVTQSTYDSVASAVHSKCVLFLSASLNTAYLVQAIFATTDFTAPNGTRTYAYKSLPNEEALVTTDAMYEALKAKNVNFYGMVMDYPNKRSFLNLGVCSDGTDIGVIANEIWLESEIVRSWFDLITSVNKVPEDETGVVMIRSVITSCINSAIVNGTISVGSELDSITKTAIVEKTGNTQSADDVSSNGYWLDVKIANGEGHYNLVYRKGDAVRFLNGNHGLV